MLRISPTTANSVNANNTPKFHTTNNETKTSTTPFKGETKAYTSENVKANFMSFNNKSNLARKQISFKGLAGGIPPKGTDESFVSVTNLPANQKMNHKYYDSTANDLAIVMGPDKSAMIVHEEGVTPELLIHRFDDNVKKGKYKKEGLKPENTHIMVINASEALENGAMPQQVVQDIQRQEPFKKKVIFVKEFPTMLIALAKSGTSPKEYFKQMREKKTQIVGLMPKSKLEPKTMEQMQAGEQPFPKALTEGLEQVEMGGLGATDTKDLLKNDRRFKRGIFNRYHDVTLDISDKAIDKLVDESATRSQTAFPNKALRVLDLVATAKLNESKAKDTEDATGHFKRVVISEPDVSKFFENHADLVKEKIGRKQFNIAENVKTRLDDVGGISDIKDDIKDSVLSYIKDPKKFLATGQKAPKGKLLVGEPGTGKTLLASAIAGEANVPFIAASGSEFVEKYVGVGAQRVRELFSNARKAAADSEKKTAIVFIDEIDAFGKKRSGSDNGGSEESAQTLNQLLTEMDGFSNKESKTKIIVLAATNRADILDPALKRPGRFDDVIEVPAPSKNENARFEILNIHSKGKPFANEVEKTKILKEASKMTMGMSGAELAEVMNKAAKIVAKRPDNKIITHNDVVEGFLQVAVGPMKKSDMTENDKKMVVRHEGGHAVVLDTLKHQDISFITLDERGSFLGAVFHQPSKDMPNFKSVVASVATSYAGGLAEPRYETMGHGAGVSGDLENGTNLIQKAVTKWGLGVYTPQLSIDEKSPMMGTYSKEVKKDMKLFSDTGHKVAKMIVDFHKDFLDKYVEKYESQSGKGGNTLSGEEFSKMREKWIKDNGKEKEYAQLQKKIAKVIKVAQNSNKGIIHKMLYKMKF